MRNTEKIIKPGSKKDLVTATATGDRLESLIALRDLLAARLQTSKSDRDIAAISRRLMQCLAEIEELKNTKEAPEQLDYLRRALFTGQTDRKTGGG